VLKIENAFPSSARLKVMTPIFSMGNNNRITQQCESLIQDFILISYCVARFTDRSSCPAACKLLASVMTQN